MRLIDADALKELMIDVLTRIKNNPKMDGQERHVIAAISMLGQMIDDAPSVELMGKWVFLPYAVDKHDKQCSVCKSTFYNLPKANYCPNCGADMRGKDNG